MISVPIRISLQEVKDFPRDSVQVNDRWNDILAPENDHKFRRPRRRSKKTA